MYSRHLRSFLEFCRKTNFDPGIRISKYLDKKVKTAETRRLAWSSIRLFYKLVLKKDCPYLLNNVRTRKRLPEILTNSEVLQILNTIKNQKHKLMISILYGSGLRVSEVINIRIKDLDLIDKKIKICNSKGNKDRNTLLSDKLIPGIRELIRNRDSKDFLFVNGQGRKYSIRTIQKIFSDALVKSGLQKMDVLPLFFSRSPLRGP